MKGRRIYLNAEGRLWPIEPGDYGQDADGLWYCRAPRGDFLGCLGDGVRHHKVIEHDDGTITVSPSILVSNHTGSWHGFLEHGIWREC
jgi:hypothetical protein